MTFEKLGLSEPVMRGVRAAGYLVPTEIQALAIPLVLSGSDVIGRAKTGSGKTAAFVLPTLDRLLAGGERKPNGVRALVLTPTRELAQQVADATSTFSRHLKLRGDAMYGGVSIEPQFKRLRNGIDILAATPGRLIDHIERGTVDLSHCEVLIVDEADRMFDMGFINDVKRIISKLPKNRQTMLFSATMSKEVRTLTASIMHAPEFVECGIEGKPAESVRQQFYSVQKAEKLDFLHHLLDGKEMESVLVFSRTKHGANKIAKRLARAGIVTGVLHSDRSQSQRQQALDGFRQGRLRVLIATDIAARGIDVVGISHVINFDTPNFAEDYVHRIGRTGRADATGEAITFVASDEKDHLRRIERFVGRRYDVNAAPAFERRPDLAAAERAPLRSEHVSRDNGKRNGSAPRHERPTQNHRDGSSRDRGFTSDRKSGGDRGFTSDRPFNGDRKSGGDRGFTSDRKSGGDAPRNGKNGAAPERYFASGDAQQGGKKRPAPHRQKSTGNPTFKTKSKNGGNGQQKFDGDRAGDGRRRDPRFA